MRNFFSLLRAHIKNIALHHTIFDLPFAYMGAFLATEGRVDFKTLFLITVAITGGRAAALAIDNFVDLKYDVDQPRFAARPMVTGEVSRRQALIFIAVNLILMMAAVACLPPICLKLLPIAALSFIIYPFTKRFTFLCTAFLGLAIGMAPAGGYVASGGGIDLNLIILSSAVGLWIGSFDTVYGAQDIAFDIAHGLHSPAVTFGAKGAFFLAAVGHILSIAAFIYLGIRCHLHWPYFLGIFIAAATLIYQHYIIDGSDFTWLTQVYFLRNGIVSIAIAVFTYLSYLV